MDKCKNLLETYLKTSEELVDNFNNMDLIILVNDGKVNVIEKGKEIKGIQHIRFSAEVDCVPELYIKKKVL